MKNKNIIYKNYLLSSFLFSNKNNKKLNKNFDFILQNISNDLDIKKDFFHTLSKKFNPSFKIQNLNRFKRFNSVAILGMGGSILGFKSIYYYLKDFSKKKFSFFDDLEINELQKIKNKSKTLFIIISKSGNTIETLSNFLSLGIIKKNSKNVIIISEKNNNLLYTISKKMNLYHIEHKNYIGGRFSVLSEVGIVPSILMGVNVKKIRKNILNPLKKNKVFLKESVIKLSTIYQKNIYNNLILLNYEPKLEKFLFWCQQLIAESLGKKGKGFLPLVSNAPRDHHSLLQLYLDGPKNKIFYIFSKEASKSLKIKKTKIIDTRLNFLNNKSLSEIKNAQKNALIKTLKKNNIPYREFRIKNSKEETLGELFSHFMIETILIGKLANVNPFNQPAVEEIKIETKSRLK